MIAPTLHLCATCGRDALVAIGFKGDSPRWLCAEHFDQELATVRRAVDALRSVRAGRDA